MAKRAEGEVVPIPTFPPASTMNLVAEEEPMTNDGLRLPATGLIESLAKGEVVPMPTWPPWVARYVDPDEVRAVVEAYAMVVEPRAYRPL